MSQVNVSKYNCDSTALESLPLDKDFNDDFTAATQTGGARRNRSQRRKMMRMTAIQDS